MFVHKCDSHVCQSMQTVVHQAPRGGLAAMLDKKITLQKKARQKKLEEKADRSLIYPTLLVVHILFEPKTHFEGNMASSIVHC